MSDVNLKKPLSVGSKDAVLLHQFDSGRIAVLVEGEQSVRTFIQVHTGRLRTSHSTYKWVDETATRIELTNKVVERVEYAAFYPQTGQVYVRDSGPIKNSQYGLHEIVQVKLTYRDGTLVGKELI